MIGFQMSLLEVPGSEVFSKGSPITAMVVVKGKSRFDLMPARNLRIVKRDLARADAGHL
jgi:hypothetical protein